MPNKPNENLATWIENIIKNFVKESPENSLKNKENDKAWEEPLVGFSNSDDSIYIEYKKQIGPFYLTPIEIFTRTFPHLKVRPDQLTVIGWILPQTEVTKSDNRKQKVHPAERWARARIYGEEFNRKLHQHVVTALQKSGYETVAPMLSPLFEWKTSENYGYASTWSERHTAHASGLGTFGLCDGLITPKGKAHRCGSVIARIKIMPTKRPYNDHHAYCLFYSEGICGKCVLRCPVGAITKNGHDKVKCRNHLEKTKEYVKNNFGFEGYGCGLCQTGVPCESKIPTRYDIK